MARPVTVEYWTARNGRTYLHRRHPNGHVSDANNYATASNARRAARKKYGPDVRLVRFAKRPKV